MGSPRFLYNDGPAKGRKAPTRLLKTVFAAIADAAWMVKASTRYVEMGMNVTGNENVSSFFLVDTMNCRIGVVSYLECQHRQEKFR